MSRFNTKSSGSKTVNLAGGEAFRESSKLELVSILLTSFAKDQFYRSGDEAILRLRSLIDAEPDKQFVAKAAIYARTEFGMRSISHVAAAEIAWRCSGQSWVKEFLSAVIYRPDDAIEILSYFDSTYGKNKRTNQLRKGIALALGKFNGYSLAKYRGEGKKIKLVDVVNFSHPKPDGNAEVLSALMKGELKSTDTWESLLTRAGQGDGTKEQAWHSLLAENKLGYFALLRNLRNIMEQAPNDLTLALEQLQNEAAIKRSLVLPFRFMTAMKEFKGHSNSNARKVIAAISKAVDIACSNVPKFEGETLVALDVSGSMNGQPAEIGALFAAVLCKASNADLVTFDTQARFVQYNGMDSVTSIAERIPFNGGGTDFKPMFRLLQKAYKRIVILSDMQGWVAFGGPSGELANYETRTGARPFIFSFDLQGYGTLQLPEPRIAALAGFSEKTLDLMRFLEEDKSALIHKIESIQLNAPTPELEVA